MEDIYSALGKALTGKYPDTSLPEDLIRTPNRPETLHHCILRELNGKATPEDTMILKEATKIIYEKITGIKARNSYRLRKAIQSIASRALGRSTDFTLYSRAS